MNYIDVSDKVWRPVMMSVIPSIDLVGPMGLSSVVGVKTMIQKGRKIAELIFDSVSIRSLSVFFPYDSVYVTVTLIFLPFKSLNDSETELFFCQSHNHPV